MAKIFISHSSKDNKIIDFFNSIFANSKVQAIYEEFEKIIDYQITPEKIKGDIDQSNAVFILLSKNTEKVPHTRDWVLWESGVSSNKEIWVFIPSKINIDLKLVIPKLSHLVLYSLDKNWVSYIHKIVQSYDDSNVFSAALVTGGIGAIIGGLLNEKDPSGGALAGSFLGGAGGLLINELIKSKSPPGLQIKCNKCFSLYNLHTNVIKFRCPVCNNIMVVTTERS